MFDSRTSALLAAAPDLPGLDASDLPAMLTRHYAALVSQRLEGEESVDVARDEAWPVERIADVYEIVASIEEDEEMRRAAAFVAGTAQQILARRRPQRLSPQIKMLAPAMPVDRDGVDASVAAALLFLAAEQYADAHEAGTAIVELAEARVLPEVGEITRLVRQLARGDLHAITERTVDDQKREPTRPPPRRLESRAFTVLLATLSRGIEHLARHMLAIETEEDELEAAQALFRKVQAYCSSANDRSVSGSGLGESADIRSIGLTVHYAGPAHLASLLLSASRGIAEASLARLPAPAGADTGFWQRWLAFRARSAPYVWRNHREAIGRGFEQTGKSAVLVLPTGAGKTTVSVLKIAGTLARGKKVIFLAPTHALVDQLTTDLQGLFPADEFQLEISSDFDALLLDDAQLQNIEVMTPERCLAMLSFAPEAFAQVGLLVFDECHLLSPSRKIGRALDSMLCLLAFQAAAPGADLLLLSAMLKNGDELAEWIAELTERPCEAVDLLWKPSRQARGVVVYDADDIDAVESAAVSTQVALDLAKGKKSLGLRTAARRKLVARPWVLWGLQHNWMRGKPAVSLTRVTDCALELAGNTDGDRIWATPNSNKTAAAIARGACDAGLKTIIFVNTKADAVRTAADIAEHLEAVRLNADDRRLLDAIGLELGDARHAIFGNEGYGAVPHNAAMLRLERMLAEQLFKRRSGAQVIVATPTLAQGLNLPAELAILAGDKRSGDDGEREDLEAHELLNAAARAGRAGHLANGVVLLIPEPLIKFSPGSELSKKLRNKLRSVLPEDDRCITIVDPLETVLDRVMAGHLEDRDVRYTINRVAALSAADGDAIAPTNLLVRSFAASRARKQDEEATYMAKVGLLWSAARAVVEKVPDEKAVLLASQSGLAIDLLDRLRLRLLSEAGALPETIAGWLDWMLDWLKADTDARHDLFVDTQRAINAALGRHSEQGVDLEAIERLRPAAQAWIAGEPLNAIERKLGGNPDGTKTAEWQLGRAREFAGTIVPRSLSFIAGVVARLAEELKVPEQQLTMSPSTLQSLSAAIRKGFDTPSKLEYANANRALVGRVEIHRSYKEIWTLVEQDFEDN